MKMRAHGMGCLFLLSTLTVGSIGHSQVVILENSQGERVALDMESYLSFEEGVNSIQEMLSLVESNEMTSSPSSLLQFELMPNAILVKAIKKNNNAPRSYFNGYTPQQKEDIFYILRTLANSSLVKIKGAEASLKKAGDRIDPIHPLQFLFVIFTNEELKVCVRNIQGRGWVWRSFLDGVTDTLGEENELGNLMPYVQDFANAIKIDVNAILPSLQGGKWAKFVDTLINTIPRSGNSGRYDM